MDDGTPYEGAYEARKTRLKRADVVLEVRPERRRSWSPAEKSQILREALTPGAVAADIIRRHGISSSLYYTWRRQALDAAAPLPSAFLPVRIEPAVEAPPPAMAKTRTPTSWAGRMEIRLACGVSVRVGSDVDADALGRVLKAVRA